MQMSKKNLYRNNQSKLNSFIRPSRSNKLSMEDITPLFTRAPSQLKKRNSNDQYDHSKMQRSTFKKAKPNCTMSIGNSIVVSKNTSPMKISMRNTQIFSEQKNKLKLYKFYYQIGFGGFGRVWKVFNKESMKDWAMKQISKRKVIQKNNIQSVLNQRKILSLLNHTFLINMKCAFQDNQNLYLVMDYLRGGDLRYHICYKDGFQQKQIKFLIACILIGLEYVHSMNIIHKDLKPQNIVYQENGYARITDFGIARRQIGQNTSYLRNQSSGTPVYMAPEILFKKQYSYQSDFYALGVIIHQLCLGKRPYQGKNRAQIRQQLLKKDICLKQADLPDGWSPYLADLINRLLKKNPSERIGSRGVQQIKEHKFFNGLKWKKLQRKQIKPPFIPNVICEMKEYLDEIALFNHLNQQNNQQNQTLIDQQSNNRFLQYDFDKYPQKKDEKKLKNILKKGKRISQKKIIA